MKYSDQIIQRLQETILSSDADYRVEAIAAALIQQGVSADCIFVQSIGLSKRTYRKDVSDFHIVRVDDDRDDLYLHTNRDGLYDALPESVFHASRGNARQPHKQEILDEMRLHRAEESDARTFFLPYEQSFQDARRVLYALEERFESMDAGCPLTELFVSEWPILQRFDSEKAYVFVRMIPLLHAIRNVCAAVAECLSQLLDAEIRITPMHYLSDSGSNVLSLGAATLGSDFVVGASASDDEEDWMLEVTLHNVIATIDFVPGGKKHGLIEELCDYFFNAQSLVSVVFTQEHDADGFVVDGSVVLGMGVRI